jgi:hypothetical protein
MDSAPGTKTVEQGAATGVWCATSPRLDGMGGVYCEDCDVAPLGRPDDAVAPAAADRLRHLSGRLTGTAPR